MGAGPQSAGVTAALGLIRESAGEESIDAANFSPYGPPFRADALPGLSR